MAAKDPDPQRSVGDLVDMTKAYALQETVEPIKGLGKFIGYGLAAAIVGACSIILLLVGVLRLVQRETAPHLTGKLTWIPYLVTMGIAGVVIAVAVAAISRKKGSN